MAFVDAHDNLIATPAPVPALPAAVGQPLIDINQLRTAKLTYSSAMETLQ